MAFTFPTALRVLTAGAVHRQADHEIHHDKHHGAYVTI